MLRCVASTACVVAEVLASARKAVPCLIEQGAVDARGGLRQRHVVGHDVAAALRRVELLGEPHVVPRLEIRPLVAVAETLRHGEGVRLRGHDLEEHVPAQAGAVLGRAAHRLAQEAAELQHGRSPRPPLRGLVARRLIRQVHGLVELLILAGSEVPGVVVEPVLGDLPVLLGHLPLFQGEVDGLLGVPRGRRYGCAGQDHAEQRVLVVVGAVNGIAVEVGRIDHGSTP